MPRYHLEPQVDAGVGVGGGEIAGQRDDHLCAQPWHPQGQANRRDPLLRLEFAGWSQGPAQNHPSALVDREKLALGVRRAAERRRSPLPGVQQRSDPGHAAESGD